MADNNGYPIKPAVQEQPTRPKWVRPAAAAALLAVATAVALAVALPITIKQRSAKYEPLEVKSLEEPLKGIDRTYFLAADVVDWDYAPTGNNLCKGTPFGEHEELYVTAGAGRKYKKALFREYTDRTFKVRG